MTLVCPLNCRRVCAWCNRVLRDGPEPTSHGICAACNEKLMAQYEKGQAA